MSNEPNEARVMNLQRFKEYIATMVIKTDHQTDGESAVVREVLGSSIQSRSGEKRALEVLEITSSTSNTCSTSSSNVKEEQCEDKRRKQDYSPESHPVGSGTGLPDVIIDHINDTTMQDGIKGEDDEDGFEIYE